jgi:hypothetical protein
MEELKTSSFDGEGVKAISRFGSDWGLHVNCEKVEKRDLLGDCLDAYCKARRFYVYVLPSS